MEPQIPIRTRPTHTFLPTTETRDDWLHKLFVRQVDHDLGEPLDEREPELTLQRGVRLLEELEARSPLTWWIGVGTALGFAREGGFIPGDTDIDVRIALDFRHQDAAMARVREVVEHFEASGFRVVREMHWDRRPMQTALADTNNHDVIFDIYYFYTSYTAGHYVNVNELGYREKPARFIDALERRPWPTDPDIEVYVPTPINEYNEWRWGPEWRTPKRRDELVRDLDERCIRDLPTQHVVLTYGTFDVFHDGHARLLERAAAMGDRLVVGVVSDAVLHEKGKSSITTQEQRAEVVASLRCVDEVFVQARLDQKESDIERFDASYLVIGDDWRDHPRFEQARGWRGAEIAYLPRTPGVSSTDLRQRAGNAERREAYGSMAALRSALDLRDRLRVRVLGSGPTAPFLTEALEHPGAPVVMLYRDPATDGCYAFEIERDAHSRIVIDLDRLEVHKSVPIDDPYDRVERERQWLVELHGCAYTPELCASDPHSLTTRYVGEPVGPHNLPPDWREQAAGILHHLERKGCQHNTIDRRHLTVLEGRLYLIDFSFATAAGEAIPSGWPDVVRGGAADGEARNDRIAIEQTLAGIERKQAAPEGVVVS